jgi:DivIVA domain-containing protein
VTGADTSEATEHHAVRSGPLGVYLDKTSVLLPRAIIGGGLSVVTLLPGLMLLVAVRRTHRFGRVLLGRGSTDSRLLRFTDTEATDTRGETKLTIRQNPDGSLALTRSSRSSPTLTVTPDPGNPRAFDVTGSDGVHIGRVERGPGPKVTADLRDDYGVLVARAETGLRPGYRFCTPAGTLIAEAGLYRKQLLLRIEPPHDTPTDRLLWAFGAVHERVLAAPSRPVEKPVPAPRLPRASRQSESASESHYRFAIVRRGYDPAQVNAFITEAAAGQLPPNPAEFTIVRRGYDQQQVDDYLDSLQHERPA